MGSAIQPGAHFEVFQYPAGGDPVAGPVWEGWGAAEGGPGAGSPGVREGNQVADERARRGEFDRRVAEETRKAFEAGRERGRQDGRQAEREA